MMTNFSWPISAGQGRPADWSNPTQTTGQVECKWVVRSMQLLTPDGDRSNATVLPKLPVIQPCIVSRPKPDRPG